MNCLNRASKEQVNHPSQSQQWVAKMKRGSASSDIVTRTSVAAGSAKYCIIEVSISAAIAGSNEMKNCMSVRITCPPASPPIGDGKPDQQRWIFATEIQHDDFKPY
jgi:hypothetical protein